ncbi:sulfotransferase 1C2-like isoform X2 [Phyllobates terribilis]|uniref:sulfotransferase 1C2-like isoform X2 n=1 Tax=Phyllobates terribilis TaxID=111132 RepID=UPI003CCA8141
MDPELIEKLVQEMADFTPEMSQIEGVPLLKGICDIWDTIYNFQARDGDIVVVSYPKSALAVANSMPSPRVLKTHLPVPVMPPSFWEKDIKIIYVARNPKDCMVSYYYFYKMDQTLADPDPWDNFFSMFLDGDVTWGSWFDHVLGWWKAKDKHKVLYVFYEDMIEDSRREIQKVMRFLGKDFSEDIIQKILLQTSFKSLKDNPMVNFSALPETVLDQSVSSFMRKGTVGDWKNHFLESQNIVFDEEYEKKMAGSGLVFRNEL